jgi:hypothetical protein
VIQKLIAYHYIFFGFIVFLLFGSGSVGFLLSLRLFFGLRIILLRGFIFFYFTLFNLQFFFFFVVIRLILIILFFFFATFLLLGFLFLIVLIILLLINLVDIIDYSLFLIVLLFIVIALLSEIVEKGVHQIRHLGTEYVTGNQRESFIIYGYTTDYILMKSLIFLDKKFLWEWDFFI